MKNREEERKQKKREKKEWSFRDLWNNYKKFYVGVPPKEEKDWCRKIFKEIIAKMFLNLVLKSIHL